MSESLSDALASAVRRKLRILYQGVTSHISVVARDSSIHAQVSWGDVMTVGYKWSSSKGYEGYKDMIAFFRKAPCLKRRIDGIVYDLNWAAEYAQQGNERLCARSITRARRALAQVYAASKDDLYVKTRAQNLIEQFLCDGGLGRSDLLEDAAILVDKL